jgi:cysteinyl-tRNA synthetase
MPWDDGLDHRQEMRSLVQGISKTARETDPDFIVITQNGHELITLDGKAGGDLAKGYLKAIDGIGREELFYGYEEDDMPTSVKVRQRLLPFMDRAHDAGEVVLVTDYCSRQGFVWDSIQECTARDLLPFAANSRELDRIPPYPSEPWNFSKADIGTLSQASNFLYLINPGCFTEREDFLEALEGTNFDVLIIDAFFNETPLTREEVDSLREKKNGGDRLVIAYMSVGEAEEYRFYWKERWEYSPPSWLDKENPDWEGNYKVRYWETGWKKVVFKGDDSYLHRIQEAGFDGVYLDLIDAYEFFEDD